MIKLTRIHIPMKKNGKKGQKFARCDEDGGMRVYFNDSTSANVAGRRADRLHAFLHIDVCNINQLR
jgi:hypothetical protein